MELLAQMLPGLQKIIEEIADLAESGGKYQEAPHVIEVTLPMLCRYHQCPSSLSHLLSSRLCFFVGFAKISFNLLYFSQIFSYLPFWLSHSNTDG